MSRRLPTLSSSSTSPLPQKVEQQDVALKCLQLKKMKKPLEFTLRPCAEPAGDWGISMVDASL